jgi:hypothetical protein
MMNAKAKTPAWRTPAWRFIVEVVKTGANLPALVTNALAKAAAEAASDVAQGHVPTMPVVVVYATGAEPVVVLPLSAFRRIADLETHNSDSVFREPPTQTRGAA